jgi:hypothetical protein
MKLWAVLVVALSVLLTACNCDAEQASLPLPGPTRPVKAPTAMPVPPGTLTPSATGLGLPGAVLVSVTPELDATYVPDTVATVMADGKACCFSWSPDREWLAYFRSVDGSHWLHVVPVEEAGTPVKLAHTMHVGYTYERPLWALEHGAIFYNGGHNLLDVALMDGSDCFRPVAADPAKTVGGRRHVPWSVDNLVWSPQRRLVIVLEINDMEHPPRLVGYELSEDLRTIVQSRVLFENANLMGLGGWLVQEETLALVIGDERVVWSLEDGVLSR